MRADGPCINDQVREATGKAYSGYAVADVLFESREMESYRSGDTNNSSSSADSSSRYTFEDYVGEHQYNKDNFTGLLFCANGVIVEYLPNSKGYSFRETVLSMLNINSMLNRKMRRSTTYKLTRYAKQGDPVASANRK